MSFTNSTENFHLPQWIGTDKPTWLIDMNNAFLDIDTALKSGETSRDNIMTLINQLSTTLGEVQDKVTEINDNLGDIPAEVGALKARVDLLVTHNNEQDLELKTIKQSIEDINTSFQSLSTTMNDMFRQRDTNFETYQQETADTLETIQGDVANTEADFALLKNELYEGDPSETNPLGNRKFALKSEIPDSLTPNFYDGVESNFIDVSFQLYRQQDISIDVSHVPPGVYLIIIDSVNGERMTNGCLIDLLPQPGAVGKSVGWIAVGNTKNSSSTGVTAAGAGRGLAVIGNGVNTLYFKLVDGASPISMSAEVTVHIGFYKMF